MSAIDPRETPAEAAQRVATHLLDQILEPGCTLSPAHDLLPNRCIKAAGEWVVFDGLDEDGHLVLRRAGSPIAWTYEPTDGEVFVSCEPF